MKESGYLTFILFQNEIGLRNYSALFFSVTRILLAMSFGPFVIGLIGSTVGSICIFERLRDRRLLCSKKFDENEVTNYLYKMVTLI